MRKIAGEMTLENIKARTVRRLTTSIRNIMYIPTHVAPSRQGDAVNEDVAVQVSVNEFSKGDLRVESSIRVVERFGG